MRVADYNDIKYHECVFLTEELIIAIFNVYFIYIHSRIYLSEQDMAVVKNGLQSISFALTLIKLICKLQLNKMFPF